MTGPSFGHIEARARIVGEMAFTCLQLSRDLGDGSMVRTCKVVISTLRKGLIPLESDVRALHRYLRSAFR